MNRLKSFICSPPKKKIIAAQQRLAEQSSSQAAAYFSRPSISVIFSDFNWNHHSTPLSATNRAFKSPTSQRVKHTNTSNGHKSTGVFFCFIWYQWTVWKDNGDKVVSACHCYKATPRVPDSRCLRQRLFRDEWNPPRCEINIISTRSQRQQKNKTKHKGKFHVALPLDRSGAVLMKPDEAAARKRGRKDSISPRRVRRAEIRHPNPPPPHPNTPPPPQPCFFLANNQICERARARETAEARC